ncbi:AAA family ATPase [Sphingopyxis sp. MWB1]|uniref:AAA family ATPase n=1 Tax=Sphingopyxis sp. MWB1 TaxID=1537715 RepID=UPI00068A9042|nr:AAA family ATPase [Sphingopyxis sp. MWB1]
MPETAVDSGKSAIDRETYPFNIPLFGDSEFDLRFDKPVTILVGENGSGKSTLLEAIAVLAGFSEGGGGYGHRAVDRSNVSGTDGGILADALRAAWLPKIGYGFFFRAETFFTLARYVDQSAVDAGFAPPDYLSWSHGEGFLGFFEERADRQGIYIFDEPESALSPSRQFEYLKLLRRIQRTNNSQVIMATHSPILMALPDADLWQITPHMIAPTTLEETAHYRLYREFISYPHIMVEAMIE